MGDATLKTFNIEIDEKVWDYLKSQAEPLIDTPNSVLRRLLFGEKPPVLLQENQIISKPDLLKFPNDVPKALSQVLEVIYFIRNKNLSRENATHMVAKSRNTDYQTIIDKYTRQLDKKAKDIDRLLMEENLNEFKLLLKEKFANHIKLIDKFFESLNSQ